MSDVQTRAAYTLNTSGRVAGVEGGLAVWYEFDDLAPFAQGYVEALFRGVQVRNAIGARIPPGSPIPALLRNRFSDLAPETLALIRRDCERAEALSVWPFGRLYNPNTAGGTVFWADRQDGAVAGHGFPPLTVTLGDDGKVHLFSPPMAA